MLAHQIPGEPEQGQPEELGSDRHKEQNPPQGHSLAQVRTAAREYLAAGHPVDPFIDLLEDLRTAAEQRQEQGGRDEEE